MSESQNILRNRGTDAAVSNAEVLCYPLRDSLRNFLALNSAFMPNLKPLGTEIALSLSLSLSL
jgi:hypothetical protein